MSSEKTGFDWRIGFAIFCLFYAGWAVYMGQSNFDKVYSEYRRAGERLEPARTREIAVNELATQCRRQLKRGETKHRSTEQSTAGILKEACLSFPAAVVAEQQAKVTQRLTIERDRLQSKLVVFYISFAIFFILLPLGLLYFLLAFLIWLFRDLKISR